MLQMDALSAWEVEHQLTSLLGKLNIHSPNRSPEHLSGGEEKRVALAATLLGNPDLIIMDEPTNHLDPSIIEWLEGHLSASNLSLLIVTHDRYFLDSVCDTIFELDNGTLYTYQGNYTHYLQKRAERLEQLEAEQQSLRNTYRRELEWMRRQPQARGTKARSRIDAFHQLEGQLGQISTPKGPQIEAQQVYIGKKIFEARQLSKSYGNKEVIKNFTYTFARHDRVGIVGPNGAGKSTLVKLILGQIPPTSGTIEIGETVRFGYFAQQPFSFPPQKKVIEVVTDIADEIEHSGGHSLSALQILTRFLFPLSGNKIT